jgi:hypothetical protein
MGGVSQASKMSDTSQASSNHLSLSRLLQLIKRLPFTLTMLIILLFMAWGTHSIFQGLSDTWVSQLGFDSQDFWSFRWDRLILSALVTNGGLIFWFALLMVTFTSGIIEWIDKSRRALVAFWGVHLVSLMLESLVFLLPLSHIGLTQASLSFSSRDVGPSAGYMGSLGYSLVFLPKRWRWFGFTGILIFLIISFLLPGGSGKHQAVKLSADMVHLIAFPLGFVLANLLGRKSVVVSRKTNG